MGALNLAIGSGSIGRVQIGALAGAFGAPLAVALACGLSALLIVIITAMLPVFRGRQPIGKAAAD